MASGGAEGDDGDISLDIDDMHMLLQVEHEQIQRRTFTNWINAQLAKRCPPSYVSDLFSELRDGSLLLDLLEVMSGQSMKRQRGRGVFQQRANLETALNFLKKKSIKLVNINIPDIIDGRPSIILGLIWTIILHCHIEELASSLSFSSRHSSLDSLASLDSWSSSPIPASPVPAGRTSPLHRRFRISAKKALLMWVRDQCQKVHCSVSVKDFKSSWRSGEVFLAILCSLRPELVDLSLVQSRSHQENLEEAFHLAERELHIPRLLDPQDVDVKDPDEKSIITYVAQFLQYSSDMPAPDDHLQLFPLVHPSVFSPARFSPAVAVSPLHQASPSERAQEVTCWLQQTHQELLEIWAANERSSYADKYQVFQRFVGSFDEQKKQVMTLLAATRRCPELNLEQQTLKTAWGHLEDELQKCKADLDLSLPPPLDSVVLWLQRAEAELKGVAIKDHSEAAKKARAQQDKLKTLMKEMTHYIMLTDSYQHMDNPGNLTVPHQKLEEFKNRLTDIQVTSKYKLIKLEYQESLYTVLDLLSLLSSKVRSWKAPYGTQEAVHALLQDWHETVERQGLLLILMDALQTLKEKMNVYSSKASIGEDSQRLTHLVKEAESEAELIKRDVTATKGMMERVGSEWITYNKMLSSLQAWLAQPPLEEILDMSEWTSCHARLNEAGNFLIEVTETSIRFSLAQQLCKVNMQWAECMKKTMFDVQLEPRVTSSSLHMVDSLIHEASLVMREPLQVASVPLKVVRQKLQTLRMKLGEVNVSPLFQSPDLQLTHIEKLQLTVTQLVKAEATCAELQRAATQLDGRLAELDHWSTDALDGCSQLKEKMIKRHSALESASRGLISRGLQLMHQVVTEWQDLQECFAGHQKTSPLQHLSTSDMQERISASLTHSQEILGKFSSLGFELQVGEFSKQLQSCEAVSQIHKDPETGSYVLTRTKYVDQIGNVGLQDPKNQHTNTEDVEDIVVPHVVIKQLSHFQSLAQDATEAESDAFSKHQAKASTHHPVKPLTASGSTSPESPVVFKPAAGSTRKHFLSSHHQNIKQSSAALQPNTPQPPAAAQQPLLIHSEVHSKAQSMARSRLEKTRLRLQGRIQQAIKLFGGKEMTQSQVKKKQKALKILQPALLEEFLCAVEGFGAFCSGPELQDLMLLSGSVRNQWEDVCREMAAFVHSLKSKIREEPVSVLHCRMFTNTLHEAIDQTDHGCLQQQIVSQEASCVEEPLRELCETLTPSRSSSLVTDQLAEETKTSETTLHHEGRRRQLEVNTPLSPTDVSAETQPCNSLTLKQHMDITQHHIPPAEEAVHVHNKDHIHHDASADNKDHLMQSKGSGWEEHQEPSPGAREQLLKARLLHITESRQQAHPHIQAVVRSNTVESKQEAEWTVIPESNVLPQKEHPSATRRMASLEETCDPTESAGDQKTIITEKLNQITSRSLDISALTVPDSMLFSDLKEIDETLKAEMRKLSEQSTEEDRRGPEATFQPSLCQPLHGSIRHLEQLGQLLDEVQSAVQALDCFLATLRDIKAEIPTLLANQDPSRQKSETDREEERHFWQEAAQRLKPVMVQAHVVDSRLKAVGMTLNMGGVPVTCQEVVKSVSKLVTTTRKQKEEELVFLERRKIQNLIETQKTGNDSAQQTGEHSNLSAMEEMSSIEARRRQQEEVCATNTQREDAHKTQTWRSEGNILKTRDQIQRRSGQIEKEGSESLVQKKAALLTTLREMKGTSEQLRLQEPSLPALQHRTRVLTELESRLAILVSEVQLIRDASQSGALDENQTREMEDLWEETTKTVTERLEQCSVLTELLRRFQNMRVKLSGTLQRAESTISEQASYVGRDYLQKLHTRVEETKVELVGLGDDIEEIRSVCRQLQSLLRHVPGCTATPFESEADALMDRWLDLSERTDFHLENLHLCSNFWDGVLQLGAEVENWTNTKLSEFTQNPCFQSENDIKALQNKIMVQEECVQRFHCRAAEIQSLLQSSEIPLELQVVETQMRKKMEQLKELVSETEDVYKQMVATKGQISGRMMECLNSLQEIQDSLRSLTGPDAASVFTKLKDLCWQLQAQDEEAQSLLDDVRVLASIAGPVGLQSLSVSGFQLEEKVRDTHQLFSEVEDQTERNIQELEGLQTDTEHLDKWLCASEKKVLKGEELNLLQEEAHQQRALQEDSGLISLYLARKQEADLRVEELQLQTEQLPALFPWPGSAERAHACCLTSQVLEESESLQLTLTGPDEKRMELVEKSSNIIWKDSSWVELHTCWSALQEELKVLCSRLEEGLSNEEHFGQLLQDCHHNLTTLQEKMSVCQTGKDSSGGLNSDVAALEVLLKDVKAIKDDLLQLETLRDSLTATSTAEARASIFQKVSDLQNHKRALESSINKQLEGGVLIRNQVIQQVGEEASLLQTELRDLTVPGIHNVSLDVHQLKQWWCTIQDCDNRMMELAVRVTDLQRMREKQETPPADVSLNVSVCFKELDSLRSALLQKKQECVETTAEAIRGIINQLQQWRQTETSNQAALDEGLQLQQAVCDVLAEQNFLLNCLGAELTTVLVKSALDVVSECKPALESLSKCLVHRIYSQVQMDLPDRSDEGRIRNEDETKSDESESSRFPASSAATVDNRDSDEDHNEKKNHLKKVLNPLKEQQPSSVASKEEDVIKQNLKSSSTQKEGFIKMNKDSLMPIQAPKSKSPSALQENNLQSYVGSKDNVSKSCSDTQSNTHEELSEDTSDSPPSLPKASLKGTRQPTIPSPPTVSDHIPTQSETISILTDDQEQEKCFETTKKVFTAELDVDLQENTGSNSPDGPRCSQELERYDPEKPQRLLTTCPKSDKSDWKSYNTDAQSETFRVSADGEIHGSPDQVFTVMLELQSWDIQPGGDPEVGMADVSTRSQGAELYDAKPAENSNTEIPEKNLKLSSVLNSPDSNKKELKCLYLSSESNPSVSVEAGMEAVKSTNGKEKNVTHEINSECLLTGEHPAQSSVAEQTENSVCFTAEGSGPSEDAPTQKDAADGKQLMPDDTKQNTGPAGEEVTGGADCKRCETPAASLLNDWRLHGALEGTMSASEQAQIQGSMEPERTAPGSPAGLGSAQVTGGSSESCKHGLTVQDVLSDIQSLVERSSIVNRTSHTDLNWYLMSSPAEADVRLARTVQRVLACRYQPAQLDVPAMAKQVKEAQEYRSCVQEQVAAMKSNTAMGLDSNAVKRRENQWSAALLDASATVQVKAAQLHQVQQYHLQMKITRAFLEVLAAKKEKISLNSLGSSALQAEHLHTFLQTMEQKKSMMEDLHHLSSRLSVHLSAAESSGLLLAQIGDLQEDWRLLRGSIKRALQHASNSTSQASLVLKEASQLKGRLEAFLEFETDNLSSLEVVCLTTDLKMYKQLYLGLQSQSEALICFSLGQKEKDEIEKNLQELGSLVSVSKKKLDSLTQSCGRSSLSRIDKQLQDLTIWAKQAENHISTGPKLALFPEEARIQIDEMTTSQTHFLSRQNKMQLQVEEMKSEVTNMESEDGEVLKTVKDLYETIADSLDHVLNSMKKKLSERQTLLSEFTSLDAWLAETHAKRDPCIHIENVSKADISQLESELKSHRLATVEIENQLQLVDTLAKSCTKISTELSPGESRYLVNRLSGLWTDLDGLLAHEKATSWELEELIHERTSSDEELSTIQASLKDISADLEQQKFPLTQETQAMIARFKHILMEHQCQTQELQHCQEDQRNSLLCSIGELLDRCKALGIKVTEQEKYSHLRRQMEESVDIVKNQIMDAKNESASVDGKFRTYLTLLVELPLVKTQYKEAADQLESIAHELHPSELNSERDKIQCIVETLSSWERSVTDDIKTLEAKLLLSQQFNPELPALTELLLQRKEQLEGGKPVSPDEKAIDDALHKYWVICRNIESGMRILECLAQKEKVDLRKYKDLYSLGGEAMEECHSWMVSLSQTRESLKDYEWAAQRALAFLHNAEATFLSAPGGFLDCTEEQKQTLQALKDLEDGFQSHICHLVERVPQQCCLSRSETELLHINVLSQLLVGRAVLEAQAQLRLEFLQRCELRRQSHRESHEDVRLRVSEFEARLSELASEQTTSYDECIAHQRRAKLLMEDLRRLVGKMEDLRAGCPVQGCGVGKDGELGALWRRWASLRRGVGLLMAHSEQKGEEWRDITTTLECSSRVSGLHAEVPDSSNVEEPLELLAQTEIHQAGLEQEQQTLRPLEHQLEHALNVSAPHDPIRPEPAGKALVKIQEDVRSLKERNLLLVAAVQAEEEERRCVQEEMGEMERRLFAVLPELEVCSDPNKRQELLDDLCSMRSNLKSVVDGLQNQHAEIPADIGRQLQQIQQSLQKAEDMQLLERNILVWKLTSRVKELGSGLERVKSLLEQKSPTLTEAQNVLKCVWDELDTWHSSLMLLESEVQDLTEEQPTEAQLLMDQLTEPLQLYQNAARMAEDRTTFLSKIPACLKEFEDIVHRAFCWLDEAQSWLSSPSSFTTAKSLYSRAKHLQLVLDDSERIRRALQEFRPVLAEISAVCDFSSQEKRLDQTDQEVHKTQRCIIKPLNQVLQAVEMVEDTEEDLKKMENDISKIRTILMSTDLTNLTLMEHLHSRQMILVNLQSMQSSLKDMERFKEELHLPEGAENLQVFSRATQLLQLLQELEQVTREQISQLEKKGREVEEETTEDFPEETKHLERSAHRRFIQEAFEVSNSEEEEDEEDESCHSSSSDTLTCSIPEDLEETLPDEQSEDVDEKNLRTDIKDLEKQFSLKEETSSATFSIKPELDPSFGSENIETVSIEMDLKADICQTVSLETMTDDSLNAEAGKVKFQAAASDLHESPKQETFSIDPQMKSPLLEETRLIPSRPITPFSAKRASCELREDEVPLSDLNAFSRPADQQELRPCLPKGSQDLDEFPETAVSSAEHEDDVEHQSWGPLHSQITKKLNTLRTVLEEQQSTISTEDGGNDEKAQVKELMSTGSNSKVLQQIHESIAVLRQMVRRSDSHPDVKDLYEALQSILLSLDSTSFLVTHRGEDDPQLKLLQQECVSAQLVTLTDLLGKLDSEVRPLLLREDPDASSCLTSLQDCLHTVQLVLRSSHSQLIEQSDLQNQHQELSSNMPFLLDESETGQKEVLLNLKDVSSLECALSRHLRKGSGEKLELQNASRSLLRGMARLLELGEECLIERRMGLVPNRSRLQAVLCRHKKLLQVLRSQLSFLQYLFQHEPDALQGQEDEWMQLEVRAKARQQQALEQEVASEKRIQDWICWENLCVRLGRVLDESETFISSGEPGGDGEDDEEESVQRKLDACEQTLLRLDDSRVLLGEFLDQRRLLQADPWFAVSVTQAGGALELRWRSAYRMTNKEIRRLKDIQNCRARFQTDFSLVSERLRGASEHLKTLTDSSDLSHDGVQSSLVKLLDFSMELEATSVLRESVSKDATLLLHLREADCLKLRNQFSQLEVSCSQMTSDLSKIQDHLQQRLMVTQPPLKLLSDLEDWLKKTKSQLDQEDGVVLKAKDATQFAEILQKYQVLRTAMTSGQHLLDFMSQPGPQMVAADVQTRSSERSVFAEKLGAVRLQWQLLQRELEKQICDVEHIHHACAEREGHLQRLHGWIEEQKKQLHQWKRPTSQALAQKALLEWEAVAGRVKEVSAALKDLKATRVHYEKRGKLSDVAFSDQAVCVSRACGDLSKQMEALRPALQQAVEEWTYFQRALGDVTLFATRVRCALQRQQAPFFSLKQAEGFSDFLQDLQVKVEAEEEQLWTAVDKSYQRLLQTLHQGTAQALGEKVEEERERWKKTVQQIKDERTKTGDVFSLWKEYSRLSQSCSHYLQHLWHEWDDLLSSLPEKDPQANVYCLKNLQHAAEELQRSMGDLLSASKHLIGRLEPLAANLIQSETRLLTRDILLLNQAILGKMKSVEEDLEQHNQFQIQLEAAEEQMNSLHKLQADTPETYSVKVVLELSDLVPSLVDIQETSGFIKLNKQEKERVDSLSRQWVKNITQASDRNRLFELQPSQDCQEKCENLKSIQAKLERESENRKPLSYSTLQEMLPVHQRLQAEIITGNQLLQDLLCDAVKSIENETGEKRSELLMQATCMKRSWFRSVALIGHNWTLMKEQLDQWKTYRHGLKSVRKLLVAVDSLLPPTGPSQYTLHQQQNCTRLYQCVEDSLGLHCPVYTQTVEVGKRLCETMTESDCQSGQQPELLDVMKDWDQTNKQLKTNKELVITAGQMWSQCQEAMTNILSELDKVRQLFTGRPEDSEEEMLIQEVQLPLQHLATGLKELATMKTDLSQYVAASDSALLEQQLEQLHCQWEELCMKVSLRRQEIADRLNAWTIFNDKNKEFCDWLTQMENKVCQSGDVSIEEMVEKLKKDCMEEINLFSENKSHLKQLGEHLLLASDEAKQSQVRGSLQEVNQRWHNLFHHIEARVKKLKETLVTVQQLDKNMSNLRSWLSRIEAELSRPITYTVCHEQEIQRRLAEHQELQRDIEQHTEGVASVLSLCDVLLQNEDAAGGSEAESDSLQETSHSLDQRWRTICTMALDRRLRIEETWTLWCKFLNDYSRFEDWLKMAERTAANPNSADVLFSVAKEELKKFESLQRQVHERLTQLELINNQYRRLARENRTDRSSHLKAMVSEGNRRWETLHRRVTAILRRLKYFTSQREEFESTRESMVVWLTELDLQLTNVEHFSESDVHQKIQQLNSFQKEITLNTERIDGLIVFGEGLIQRSSPQDAALIEDELEELHSYCQEVFSRLVRFHQRLSQPPMIKEEPDLTFSLESSLELIGRPWLGRSQGSLPATPTHLLTSPLERSGRETPVSMDSLPLEWDHTVDVGGSSHEEDEEEEGPYFSALSVSSRSLSLHECPRWRSSEDTEDQVEHAETTPTLTSTPVKQGYLHFMSQCSGSIENLKRVSLILDDEEQQEEFGLMGLNASDKQSGVIERWELLRAQSRCSQQEGPQEPQQLTSDLDDITSWLENVIPELDRLLQSDPAAGIEDMEARAKDLKEMEKMFSHYKSIMLTANLQTKESPDSQEKLAKMNRDWSRACTGLQQWDSSLRRKLIRCQEFHESLHSLLLWLAHAESRCSSVNVNLPKTSTAALQQHTTLTELQEELRCRRTQQASLQALWSQLQPEEAAEDTDEAQEKLHVTGNKLKQLVKQVDQNLHTLQQRLDCESALAIKTQSASADMSQEAAHAKKGFSTQREMRESSPPRSFFYRLLRAAFPLQLLLLLLLLLPCLIPLSESDHGCTVTNNFARSFYPMLHYTNGPPPT